MGYYDINVNVMIWRWMPGKWRKAVHYAWLKCLLQPVRYVQGLFATNRAGNLYRLKHTSQICYLESALNDVFDPLSRRIYISDPVYSDPVWLFRRSERKPVYLYRRSETTPVYLYRRSEMVEGAIDFIINVPAAVTYDSRRMRAMVNLQKLVSKRYSIVVF